jgi:hypothetical protein
LSIIKHVTLQKIVAHDFEYDPHRKEEDRMKETEEKMKGRRNMVHSIKCQMEGFFYLASSLASVFSYWSYISAVRKGSDSTNTVSHKTKFCCQQGRRTVHIIFC